MPLENFHLGYTSVWLDYIKTLTFTSLSKKSCQWQFLMLSSTVFKHLVV